MKRCVKCGKKTKLGLSFDIDLPVIAVHKKCQEDVRLAFMLEKDIAKSFTKDWYQPFI